MSKIFTDGVSRVAFVAALLAVLLLGCRDVGTIGGEGFDGASAAASPGAAPGVRSACDSPPTIRFRDLCGAVEVQGRPHRYLLDRREGATGTVLVDLGGPGVSALARTNPAMLRDVLGDRMADQHMLLVEEPWVQGTFSDDCTQALADLRAAMGAQDVPAADDASRQVGGCLEERRWGFTSDLYVQLIDAIEVAEDVVVDAFAGTSFASTRRAYLQDRPLRWTAVADPFPVGADAQDLIAARAAAVDTPGSTDADLLAAAVAAAAEGEPSEVLQDPEVVRQLSASQWQAYGAGAVSPASLAYLQETCGALTGWSDVTPEGPVATFLADFLRPCQHADLSSPAIAGAWEGSCAVVDPDDPVTPGPLAEDVLDAVVERFIEQEDAAPHGDLTDLLACSRAGR